MGGKNRLPYIDIVKGWAILMVVYGHISFHGMPRVLNIFFGSQWKVGAFFIIAGYFLKTDKLSDTRNFIMGKINGLYLPATIIYVLAVLLHNLFVDIGWYPLGEPHPSSGIPFDLYGLKEIAIGCIKALCCAGSGELAMGAMWFLYSLLYAFIGLAIF